MHILVLQHERVEHPGIFRNFLAEDGHTWDPVELDEGEALPALDGYDALWVMGGPMDTWQEDEHPWLKDEKELLDTYQNELEEIRKSGSDAGGRIKALDTLLSDLEVEIEHCQATLDLLKRFKPDSEKSNIIQFKERKYSF